MRTNFLVATVLGVWCAQALAECPDPEPGMSGYRAGQVTLRVADYADSESTLAQLETAYPGMTVIRSVPSRKIYMLQLPTGALDCDVVEILLETLVNPTPRTPDANRPLEFAELNFEAEAGEGSTGSIYVTVLPSVGAARYSNQPVLTRLGAASAHTRSTGRGVVVAVLDTGVDGAHPELQGAILPGYDFVSMADGAADIGDLLDTDGDGSTDEMVGHGTFIAGLIHSVAPDAKILPLKVLEADGVGDATTIAQAMYFAIDRGVEVINLSLGSTTESEVIADAIEDAQRHGIVVVTAAGNEGVRSPKRYPSATSGAIGVAAVDANGVREPYSNYHSDIFISAPGGMASADANEVDPNRAIISVTPSGYGAWAGTSLSAAFVSGAAALIRAQHPEWRPNSNTAEMVADALRGGAIDIDSQNPGFVGLLGAGALNVGATIANGPISPRVGDLNADGAIDLADLARLLADYSAPHSSADFDGSGRVDLSDLALMLAVFGT